MSDQKPKSLDSIRKLQVEIVNRLLERKQVSLKEASTLLCTIGPVEVTNGGQFIMGDHHEHIEKTKYI